MEEFYVIDMSDNRNILVSDRLSLDGRRVYYLNDNAPLEGATVVFAPNKVLRAKEMEKFGRAKNIFCGKRGFDRDSQTTETDVIKVHEYMRDAVFCTKNSELTAEATLYVLLGKLSKPIAEQKILVIGYGRCGRAICKFLYDLRCDVTAATGRLYDEVLLAKPIGYDETEFSKYDVIINTAPKRIISDVELRRLKCGVIVIDIASAPYGLNHELAKVWGIDAEVYPSLPAKHRAKAAADAMYAFIKRKENDNA